MWAVVDHAGAPMLDTLSDSADEAISVVAKRIDTDYDGMLRVGFALARVDVAVTVLSEVRYDR